MSPTYTKTIVSGRCRAVVIDRPSPLLVAESIPNWERWTGISTISNGFCRFNPTTQSGKWIFVSQTVLLSFTPLVILLIQNSINFNDLLIQQERNLEKARLVSLF